MSTQVTILNDPRPAMKWFSNMLKAESARNNLKEYSQAFMLDYYTKRNQARPNRMGGIRTNYWAAFGRTAFSWWNGATLKTGIGRAGNAGLRLHYHGGTVKPGVGTSSYTGRPTKYLTIPKAPEAHGKRVSDFAGLRPVYKLGPGGRPQIWALAVPEGGLIAKQSGKKVRMVAGGKYVGSKKVNKAGEIMFTLTDHATIRPDPTSIPSEREYADYIHGRIVELHKWALSQSKGQTR